MVTRYSTKQLRKILFDYIISLGRIPTQHEVRMNPNLPSDETFLFCYDSWEDLIISLGFTMSWCTPALRQRMLDDLWTKYIELGYKIPSVLDIQNSQTMEKVWVYKQIFGELRFAYSASGILDDYRTREKKNIAKTILQLSRELGRVPKIKDKGMPNEKVIYKVFGTYENALLYVGMQPNYRYYSRERLIYELRNKYRELGRPPLLKEVDNDPGMASAQTYRRVFKNYRGALRAAKIPVSCKSKESIKPVEQKQVYRKYTKEELVDQLKSKFMSLGRTPMQVDIDNDPTMASVNSFVNYFGSYNDALLAAGIKPSKKREYTDEELLYDLRQKYISVGYLETGKIPTNKDIDSDPNMASTRAYYTHFGSTNKARRIVEKGLLTMK